MPTNAARAVRDLAEVINRLWGHCTPGGRLYPTPLPRRRCVVSWADDQEATGHLVFTMAPTALAGPTADGDHASSFMVLLTAAADVDNDKLYDFDARYERTLYPSEWLWGPGTRLGALGWLDAHGDMGDEVSFLDRVFAVQSLDGRTYRPRRPGVALGPAEERRGGTWYLVRADYPDHAFNHVRHGGGLGFCPKQNPVFKGCPVEEVYEGPWAGMESRLRDLGSDTTPLFPPAAKVPNRYPPPVDIGDD